METTYRLTIPGERARSLSGHADYLRTLGTERTGATNWQSLPNVGWILYDDRGQPAATVTEV